MTQQEILDKLETLREGWVCFANGVMAIRGKDDDVGKTLKYCSKDINQLIIEIVQTLDSPKNQP